MGNSTISMVIFNSYVCLPEAMQINQVKSFIYIYIRIVYILMTRTIANTTTVTRHVFHLFFNLRHVQAF
jgi:hypothetical protein